MVGINLNKILFDTLSTIGPGKGKRKKRKRVMKGVMGEIHKGSTLLAPKQKKLPKLVEEDLKRRLAKINQKGSGRKRFKMQVGKGKTQCGGPARKSKQFQKSLPKSESPWIGMANPSMGLQYHGKGGAYQKTSQTKMPLGLPVQGLNPFGNINL